MLQEQIAYYDARASEYDEWFLRRGRYDRGPEWSRKWFDEVSEVASALEAFAPAGQVLELACGTGLWTQWLVGYAEHVTAVDSSDKMLTLNRARVGESKVDHVKANIFSWRPGKQYDVVFFSFWLSHVPPEHFADFWNLVRGCLRPNGRVFFVDSLYDETSTARDHRLEGRDATTMTRRLNDGQEFRILKVFYDPDELANRLADLGWNAQVRRTPTYFLYGFGAASHRPDADPTIELT
jgi:demethylmenaquinone methyltransferase/2-methoxy-6-polyprenyl-1,4-benzoquinol methylase